MSGNDGNKQSGRPWISIIIPCYNAAAFLPETISSLEMLSTVSPGSFLVIFSDDGSTDGTPQFLEQLSVSFSFQTIRGAHSGVSHARNAALALVKTKYVLFLDADDKLHPRLVSLLRQAVRSNPDTVFWSRTRDLRFKDLPASDGVPAIRRVGMAYTRECQLRHLETHEFCCYLYRSDLILRHGLLFDERTAFLEDREFLWKYLCFCRSSVEIGASLYACRKHSASASQSRDICWDPSALLACRRIYFFLKNRNDPFASGIRSILFPRVMWTQLRRCARAARKDLFCRMYREYPAKSCMKRLLRYPDLRIRISALLFLIHPSLFYDAVKLHDNGFPVLRRHTADPVTRTGPLPAKRPSNESP